MSPGRASGETSPIIVRKTLGREVKVRSCTQGRSRGAESPGAGAARASGGRLMVRASARAPRVASPRAQPRKEHTYWQMPESTRMRKPERAGTSKAWPAA